MKRPAFLIVSLALAVSLGGSPAFAQTTITTPAPPMPQITDSPVLPASAATGKVDFAVNLCDSAKWRVFKDGTIHYSIWSGVENDPPNWHTDRNVRWQSGDPSALHQSFTIPPGAYSYEVTATHGHDSSLVYCSLYYYVVVLPGSERHVPGTMYEGMGDPIPLVFIYGLANPDADVAVFRYPTNPTCGSRLAGLRGVPLDVRRDAVGYYADDSYFSSWREHGAVFGVRVTPNGATDSMTFRVVANYPDSVVSIVPTSARLDLTQMLLDSAHHGSANTLLCQPAHGE